MKITSVSVYFVALQTWTKKGNRARREWGVGEVGKCAVGNATQGTARAHTKRGKGASLVEGTKYKGRGGNSVGSEF